MIVENFNVDGRDVDIKGCSVLPAYPYISDNNQRFRMTMMTSPKKPHNNTPPLRSRSSISGSGLVGDLPSPEIRVLSRGSGARHIRWVMTFGRPRVITLGNTSLDATIAPILSGTSPIDTLGYRPMRSGSRICVIYASGFTNRNNPRIFEEIRELNYDGSGAYYLGAKIDSTQHGSWQEGDESGWFRVEFRCRRYLAYRDCQVESGGLTLGTLVGAMRPGRSAPNESSNSSEFEPYSYYYAPADEDTPSADAIPMLENYLSSTEYTDSVPTTLAIKQVHNSAVSSGNYEHSLRMLPDLRGTPVNYVEWATELSSSGQLHCDVLVESFVWRYVKLVRLIQTGDSGFKSVYGIDEAAAGWYGTTGRIWFCF